MYYKSGHHFAAAFWAVQYKTENHFDRGLSNDVVLMRPDCMKLTHITVRAPTCLYKTSRAHTISSVRRRHITCAHCEQNELTVHSWTVCTLRIYSNASSKTLIACAHCMKREHSRETVSRDIHASPNC